MSRKGGSVLCYLLMQAHMRAKMYGSDLQCLLISVVVVTQSNMLQVPQNPSLDLLRLAYLKVHISQSEIFKMRSSDVSGSSNKVITCFSTTTNSMFVTILLILIQKVSCCRLSKLLALLLWYGNGSRAAYTIKTWCKRLLITRQMWVHIQAWVEVCIELL